MTTELTVYLQVWDDNTDTPTEVEVEVEYDPGQTGTYDEPGYGPSVNILSTTPEVDIKGYEKEVGWLCEDEMRSRREYFIDLREAQAEDAYDARQEYLAEQRSERGGFDD